MKVLKVLKVLTGQTVRGNPFVAIHDGKNLILKAYPSPDGKRIRIVLPELCDQRQCSGEVSGPVWFIDFTRSLPSVDNTSRQARTKQGETTNGKVQQP